MAGFHRFARPPRAISAPLTVTAIGFVDDSTVATSPQRAASALSSLFSLAAYVSGSKVALSVGELPSKSEAALLPEQAMRHCSKVCAPEALIGLRGQSRKRRAR
jgi:hypothetical protein